MTMPVWYMFGLWILWILQFVLFRPKRKSTPIEIAPNFRWGIGLQILGYWAILLPARTLWAVPIPLWRILAGVAFGLVGIWLASSGVRHLGKQWQIKAAINDDHELVTSGPYQIVRHPIYASMIAMMIMCVFLLGRLPWWPIGIVLFLAGIEIRIHVEDGLLRDRFGQQFEAWKKKRPAYLPLIR
jgi:protein-S-isoprenylcysteine O-methyltransferase Ste14